MSSETQPTPNLDFRGVDTSYLTHGMHSFPARFPPQIVGWALDEFLDRKNATVLDPMCGSGTTLVESVLNGHNALGIDKDPLARLISRVKTTPLNEKILREKVRLVRAQVTNDINYYRIHSDRYDQFYPPDDRLGLKLDVRTIDETNIPQWQNLQYWFFDEVIDELSLICGRIRAIENDSLREFFEVTLSATLITKGRTSLINAHDIAHSRAHRVEPDTKPDVLRRFLDELESKIKTVIDYSYQMEGVIDDYGVVRAKIIGDDARDIDLNEASVDLIVTSPPYINALNYLRATKFALYWLRWPDLQKSELGDEYIGTNRVGKAESQERLENPSGSETADCQIQQIAEKNTKMAGVVHRFVEDMHESIEEMYRVLKPGSHCVIVIGNSDIRDINVQTHKILHELASDVGFLNERTIPRNLDSNKRSLPTNRGDMKDGMHDEHVLQWYKPE